MYLIIGKLNCSSCDMAKTVLDNKGIEFKYILLEDCDKETKAQYMKLAKEQGKLSMPLILKENKLYTLQEVISCI